MTRIALFSLAMFLSVAATLCFLAGQPRFGYLEPDVAQFAGTAGFMVSGVIWGIYGITQIRGNSKSA